MNEKKTLLAVVVKGVGLLRYEDEREPEEVSDAIGRDFREHHALRLHFDGKIRILPMSTIDEITLYPYPEELI